MISESLGRKSGASFASALLVRSTSNNVAVSFVWHLRIKVLRRSTRQVGSVGPRIFALQLNFSGAGALNRNSTNYCILRTPYSVRSSRTSTPSTAYWRATARHKSSFTSLTLIILYTSRERRWVALFFSIKNPCPKNVGSPDLQTSKT